MQGRLHGAQNKTGKRQAPLDGVEHGSWRPGGWRDSCAWDKDKCRTAIYSGILDGMRAPSPISCQLENRFFSRMRDPRNSVFKAAFEDGKRMRKE
ncbi:MAG: hypothetical protein AB1584_12285 [Pseudomonadota bacterium]